MLSCYQLQAFAVRFRPIETARSKVLLSHQSRWRLERHSPHGRHGRHRPWSSCLKPQDTGIWKQRKCLQSQNSSDLMYSCQGEDESENLNMPDADKKDPFVWDVPVKFELFLIVLLSWEDHLISTLTGFSVLLVAWNTFQSQLQSGLLFLHRNKMAKPSFGEGSRLKPLER